MAASSSPPTPSPSASALAVRISALAEKYQPLAEEILREAIRIPADHTDDALCGTSAHERPRLDYLREMVVRHGAVERAEDVEIDAYGCLVWRLHARDAVPGRVRMIWFDGHSDTVMPLADEWRSRVGAGLHPHLGLVDPDAVSEAGLANELGYAPLREEWSRMVWGRGSADQLAGVVSQIVATKIILELRDMGALPGNVAIRSIATVSEEDNDGGAPMFYFQKELPGAPVDEIPDVVVITEGTGDSRKGALGIYRGQRGRTIVEVEVVGKSCHGSMPWEGKNPLEAGARILAEATEQYERRETFATDEFLGEGSRTASWAVLDSPSYCAVPARFTFLFDRRLTTGETVTGAREAIEQLKSVQEARSRGFEVAVRTPLYSSPTNSGFVLNNPQFYPSWCTPPEHVVVRAAMDAYRECVSPHVVEDGRPATLKREPRLDRWIFSTDGVGYVIPTDHAVRVPAHKNWVATPGTPTHHPPMFGIGAGIEQNTHKIGEWSDPVELRHAIAVIARFPSLWAALAAEEEKK